jgi:signal transduction histidine kinase
MIWACCSRCSGCSVFTANKPASREVQDINLDQRFLPRVEINAYRVIQESLTNIIRHAVNKPVEGEVMADDQVLKLRICDQGGGFDLHAALEKKTSTGLSGKRERAHQLGGELSIDPKPGQGTTLAAVLPLKSQTGPLIL